MVEQKRIPELFLGLVGAVGTDLDMIGEKLKTSLRNLNYETEIISLSSLLKPYLTKLGVPKPTTKEDERINILMNAGDKFREIIKNGNALAVLAMTYVREVREKNPNNEKGQAYIFKSLKHHQEVEILWEVYGKNFWLVSVYSPRDIRVDNLALTISKSYNQLDSSAYRSHAEILINRDEFEKGMEFGQNVRDTFPLADVFIDAGSSKLKEAINRFIELIFGNTFHTPSKEEFGMFYAKASALRSSSLSRQVGSSIMTEEGDVVSTGTNEVPKAGGGLYDSSSDPDGREWKMGYDSNDERKKQMLKDLLENLKKLELLDKQKIKYTEEISDKVCSSVLKDIQLMDLTEFGREIHAEMASLMDAARRTINVKDCIMYCTTFPCHVCAKHIIASGLKEVVYIEPYPKSLAKELFGDSIILGEEKKKNHLNFRSFVGISPRRYIDLFNMADRKKEGKMVPWDNSQTSLRYYENDPYMKFKENTAVSNLNNLMKLSNLK